MPHCELCGQMPAEPCNECGGMYCRNCHGRHCFPRRHPVRFAVHHIGGYEPDGHTAIWHPGRYVDCSACVHEPPRPKGHYRRVIV